MKKIVVFFPIIAFFISCTTKEMKVTVENPSNFDRLSEMVEIPVAEIKAQIALANDDVYVVTDSNGEVVPSQLTFDGKLIFQSKLKAKETGTFTIQPGKPQTFKAQTFGRFISERKDDFAWENDRVAFRIYGQALVPIDGPSNGLDVWYKRTSELIIDKWYEKDLAGIASYHNDNGEGQDDYKVGRTLGAGAMAPYTDNKLWLNENYVSQEVFENGPLRTTFKLTYKEVGVADKTYSEARTFSIDAGSQLTKVIQEYGFTAQTPVAAGLVKRGNDSIIVSPENDFIIYVEPFSQVVDQVYLALVFPGKFESTTIDACDNAASHVLAITTYQPNAPVMYYTGYGWSKFGFASLDEFQQYIQHFTEALQQPFIINY
jgi:hypothetical protein